MDIIIFKRLLTMALLAISSCTSCGPKPDPNFKVFTRDAYFNVDHFDFLEGGFEINYSTYFLARFYKFSGSFDEYLGKGKACALYPKDENYVTVIRFNNCLFRDLVFTSPANTDGDEGRKLSTYGVGADNYSINFSVTEKDKTQYCESKVKYYDEKYKESRLIAKFTLKEDTTKSFTDY